MPDRLVQTVDGKVGHLHPTVRSKTRGSGLGNLSASKRVNAMERLVVDSEVRPEAVLVHASGEIDSSTAGELKSQLESALHEAGGQDARLLIVDLNGVNYFGSAGLNAVLDVHKQGLRAGISVRLVADNDLVVRPIEVTNLDSLLDLYPTLPDALEGRDSERGS